MSFIDALKSEIAKLQVELTESLPYKRLAEAKRMLALYQNDAPAAGSARNYNQGSIPYVAVEPEGAAKHAPRRGSPERAKALDAARMFLANRASEPTPTSAIYDHIASLGIEISGNEPRNNLSAMLSNSPIFQSHGRAGWTLAGSSANVSEQAEFDPDLPRAATKNRELEMRNYDAPPPPPPPLVDDDLL